jgi:dTDP-glucose pyrophosphorylase
MRDLVVLPNISIKQALKKLSVSGEKCLIVADENNILLGTVTDGDLRNSILKGVDIRDSISSIYHSKPTFLVRGKYELEQAKNLFLEKKFNLIPIIDEKCKVVDALGWGEVFKSSKLKKYQNMNIPVVIMAGGLGSRLEPFTKVLPKPLIPIQEKPVIEHIIERFTKFGVNQFFLSINHKARIMKAYFDELNPDYSVKFVEEKEPLGTAGSLKFLQKKIKQSFIVTNCDIIIKADYPDIYNFHSKNDYDITLVASVKNYIIPYGTCETNDEGYLKKLNEKPELDFLINIGLYVLKPEILQLISGDKLYHITHLIEDAQKIGKRIGIFPIDDDAWVDVGQWAEYQKAVEQL